jgi:hypothetical protein
VHAAAGLACRRMGWMMRSPELVKTKSASGSALLLRR